jgi:hypothetical protein
LLLNDKECQGLSACDNEQTLDDKLFECFSESPQRTDQQADEKSRLAEEFELNRVKIVQFNARLRMVEWLATTTDFKIHPIIGKAGHESKN